MIYSLNISFEKFCFSLSSRVEDTQSNNTVKNNDEGLFVKRLRSLFPAIEIKVEHVRFSRIFLFLRTNLFIVYRVEYQLDIIHYLMVY
jgi:hypothetical protein